MVIKLTQSRITQRWSSGDVCSILVLLIRVERSAHCGQRQSLAGILVCVSGERDLGSSRQVSFPDCQVLLWFPLQVWPGKILSLFMSKIQLDQVSHFLPRGDPGARAYLCPDSTQLTWDWGIRKPMCKVPTGRWSVKHCSAWGNNLVVIILAFMVMEATETSSKVDCLIVYFSLYSDLQCLCSSRVEINLHLMLPPLRVQQPVFLFAQPWAFI